jgi:two-component system, NarL family, sensor histidine kinase UhpB
VKRPALLTQVLAVNALLIAATVLAATVTVHLDPNAVADRRRLGLLVVAVLATVLVNGLVLRRRFAPLEQLT